MGPGQDDVLRAAWGSGTLGDSPVGQITQYRYDLGRARDRSPGDQGAGLGTTPAYYDGAILAFKFFNCWTASVGFSGLNAQDNNILIHQMQVHHEGFEVYFGHTQADQP